MILERRWEIPGRPTPIYDFPKLQTSAAWSIFWWCYRCGKRYAEMRSWIDEKPQIWDATCGCCPDCKGHTGHIPGSIESFRLINKELPYEVLAYQLNCELRFLHHPDHPHNKELSL